MTNRLRIVTLGTVSADTQIEEQAMSGLWADLVIVPNTEEQRIIQYVADAIVQDVAHFEARLPEGSQSSQRT